MAAWGLKASDFDHEYVEVWPETELAYSTFSRLGTQWRVGGMGSATGLDYTAVLAFIRTLRLPREQADELFEDIQVMEAEALAVMAENMKDK
ncbi:MAG TPA: DUF1799 domain-containing protein [Burkholderiaceae bacterium]|nr:DUF1799 domain-containing protein [Burkholderiaceae bacterium]HNM39999.1 DUF1799 domain-containing protein [Giesbergeria sp.]